MKLIFSNIKNNEELPFTSLLEDYFSDDSIIVKKVNKSEGSVIFTKAGSNILIANFNIKFNINVLSSYSNEYFDADFKLEDELYLTNLEENESEDVILVNESFDLDEIVYSLLITSIPTNFHKVGETLNSGKDYKVMTEDEFYESKKEEGNVFDKLKNIDLD